MGKGQKMKGKSISLQEFTADVVQNDPSALPTAPREDTGDGYGDRYDRYERREGREGDRFGGRPQSYVNEDGERVEVISQADTVSSWRGDTSMCVCGYCAVSEPKKACRAVGASQVTAHTRLCGPAR